MGNFLLLSYSGRKEGNPQDPFPTSSHINVMLGSGGVFPEKKTQKSTCVITPGFMHLQGLFWNIIVKPPFLSFSKTFHYEKFVAGTKGKRIVCICTCHPIISYQHMANFVAPNLCTANPRHHVIPYLQYRPLVFLLIYLKITKRILKSFFF